MNFIEPYKITILVIGLTGFIFLLQLLVADIIGIKAKHTPGHPVTANHDDLLFRVSRTFSNSNESAAILILFVSFALLSSANPQWLNISAVIYLTGRVAHMLCYYLNLQLCRSISFVISLIGLMAIFASGVFAWL